MKTKRINHISIEGIDGVGKTTVSLLLAKKMNYKFVEKPLHYLFDNDSSFSNYLKIRNRVNKSKDRVYTAWFYGLGSVYLYEKFASKNIITDRHLASNYAWSYSKKNSHVFDAIIKSIGKPKLTIILSCKKNELINRLKKRNPHDKNLLKVNKCDIIYKRMVCFCKKWKLPYTTIDTTNKKPNEIVNIIIKRVNNEKS